ncbi:MAG TPA: Trm112 family protein [Candidatus Nanoarchaeia archaeon]|nr:Trm112 family protein [Candidatus Nanoarchaeia archaeon]
MLKNKDIRRILCCPDCKGSLSLNKNTLSCKKCPATYPIHAGVPLLLHKTELSYAFEDISELNQCRKTWENKKILRKTYRSWYKKIAPFLDKNKLSIELSAGIGNFKDSFLYCISSDIRYSPYIDLVTSSTSLPFSRDSISTLVVIDGIHHYTSAFSFLNEALRVLEPKGKLILVEPYLSPFSYVIRKLFHHEDIDFFSLRVNDKALDANLAIPTILFYKRLDVFKKNFPKFTIIHKEVFEYIVYPLTGGFHRNSLVPDSFYPLLRTIEQFLPFKSQFAFKTMVVLEKQG